MNKRARRLSHRDGLASILSLLAAAYGHSILRTGIISLPTHELIFGPGGLGGFRPIGVGIFNLHATSSSGQHYLCRSDVLINNASPERICRLKRCPHESFDKFSSRSSPNPDPPSWSKPFGRCPAANQEA